MAGLSEVQSVVLDEIKRQVEELRSRGLQGPAEAAVIQQLALAFRFAAGGPQPGGQIDPR